jgi:hypothetical protein
VLDAAERVTDAKSFAMTGRLLREEGGRKSLSRDVHFGILA